MELAILFKMSAIITSVHALISHEFLSSMY